MLRVIIADDHPVILLGVEAMAAFLLKLAQ